VCLSWKTKTVNWDVVVTISIILCTTLKLFSISLQRDPADDSRGRAKVRRIWQEYDQMDTSIYTEIKEEMCRYFTDWNQWALWLRMADWDGDGLGIENVRQCWLGQALYDDGARQN